MDVHLISIRRSGRRALRALPSLAIALLLLAAWQIYADTGHVGDDVLPSPSRVASQGWANRHDLWENTLPTLRATVVGSGRTSEELGRAFPQTVVRSSGGGAPAASSRVSMQTRPPRSSQAI